MINTLFVGVLWWFESGRESILSRTDLDFFPVFGCSWVHPVKGGTSP